MRDKDSDHKQLLARALLSIKKNEKRIRDYESARSEPIAIVGAGCRFPGKVKNLVDLHDLLSNGLDAITDVPEGRWDMDHYYHPDRNHPGKICTHKGGFIEDVDGFDAMFFQLSPAEVQLMDPQQRICLEMTWQALENANILPSSLYKEATGVFFGVSTPDYLLNIWKGLDEKELNGYVVTGNSHSTLAGRISHHFGLKGPCMSVDTACSSSLTAIHYACKSLRDRECNLALTGGVNLMFSPLSTMTFSQAGMLSPDGHCHTFDAAANGYVRSEGAAVIVLKRMSDALKDGDRILAKILGTAINHNGPSGGLTVPNGTSQQEVIRQALKNAKVDSSEIDYVEAHGTGTPLGDPIEVNALNKVLGEGRDPKRPLTIGSIKTNIGHTEAAAGIAGLLKLVLQLQHQEVYPHLHFNEPSPKIPWDAIAIKVPKEGALWTSNSKRRIGGVSSFGVNGSNAHAIVEEHRDELRIKNEELRIQGPFIVPLSAKHKERLKEMAQNLARYLDHVYNLKTDIQDSRLQHIAYTLQTSREPMEERLALVVQDVQELKERLSNYVRQGKGAFTGNAKKEQIDFFLQGEAGKIYIDTAIEKKEYSSLAQLWVKGVNINWGLLYPDGTPDKISLPTYPFAKESYWFPRSKERTSDASAMHLHPLLHSNESDLSEQKYQSVFAGNEAFLQDHKVEGKQMLPGVAYLEMAREAGTRGTGSPINHLRNITWLRPITVNGEPTQITTSLFEDGQSIGYEIYGSEGEKEQIYARGTLDAVQLTPPPDRNIEQVKGRMENQKLGEECYKLFKEEGLAYGDHFQRMEVVHYNKEESLSKIIPSEADSYVLPPYIMDSALQTCIGLEFGSGEWSLSLPYSVEEVAIYGEVNDTHWCYARRNPNNRERNNIKSYDIDLLSETGKVLLRFKGFATLPVDGSLKQKYSQDDGKPSKGGLYLYSGNWRKQALENDKEVEGSDRLVILVGGSEELAERLAGLLSAETMAVNELGEIAYFNTILKIIQHRLKGKGNKNFTLLYNNRYHHKYAFIAGLLKTVALEYPGYKVKVIGVDSLSLRKIGTLIETVQAEWQDSSQEVRYLKGEREVLGTEALAYVRVPSPKIRVKEGGVYLITGGVGGLGKLFADHIAKTKDTLLILTGRNGTCRLNDKELKNLNATYYPCDVTDKKAVEQLVRTIMETHGKLTGIIHSAGVIRDNLLLKKTAEEATAVLRPKIDGVRYLDEVTKDLDLDFVVYFSSLAAVLGNVGQGDYVSANAWMDHYATYRNSLRSQGKRKGITLSINWPLWKDGGMQVDTATETYLEQELGMYPLPTEKGLEVFERFLNEEVEQGIVVYGDVGLDQAFSKLNRVSPEKKASPSDDLVRKGGDITFEALSQKIKEQIQEVFKTPIDRLEVDKDLEEYGGDSILFADLVQQLNTSLGIYLATTALFEYRTIKDLTHHILKEHTPQIQEDEKPSPTPSNQGRRNRKIKRVSRSDTPQDAYAIVAASGRFSSVETAEELWQKVVQGTTLTFSQQNGSSKGLPYGTLSPKQLEDGLSILNLDISKLSQMSYQEQLVFDALSNAMVEYGLDREAFTSRATGVFIAAQQVFESAEDPYGGNNTLAYLIPNKVSFHLNLKGPSEVVNTYCTSGYVAIHRAIQSMVSGECEQAIVGGVNVIPKDEMALAENSEFFDLLSKNGRTKSFCDDAQGFVRSEGVGIALIKPLRLAKEDNNQILGIIKGTAVSHGGKAFALEAPSAKGIKKVIETSLSKSGVPVDTIDYIEAHGIANPMADAIELGAVNTAYRALSKDSNKKWHIGSVKPTLGHPELASGMASLLKVLKAFEHRTLPGIAGLDRVNTELAPDHTLVLNKTPTPWKRSEHPRRAALNGYAVGGVNAHIILEEYRENGKVEEDPLPITAIVGTVDPHGSEPIKGGGQDTESLRGEIVAIAYETFGLKEGGIDTDRSPIDYDFDSVKVIQFVRRVNAAFDIDVKMGQILSADDFESMFELFEKAIVVSKETDKDAIEDSQEALPTVYPLSEGQKGLHFIQLSDPLSVTYNVPVALEIHEDIDPEKLYQITESLLEAHPILRTVFTLDDKGETIQQVQPVQGYLERDVQELRKDETFIQVFKTLKGIPFDLTREVFRLYIRTSKQEQKTGVFFVIHHIVVDGTSASILLSKFLELLRQHQNGMDSLPLPADRNYFDFIAWEQDYIQSKAAAEDVEYWKHKLLGNIEPLELPYDHIPKQDRQAITGTEQLILSKKELQDLKTTAKSLRVNLSVLMLSAFKVLLYKLTGMKDITVTIPTAGRPKEQYQDSIGFYINMMLSTDQIYADESFSNFTDRVRSGFLSDIDHLRYPYPKLLTALDLTRGRDNDRSPVSYVYQNIFDKALAESVMDDIVVMESLEQEITNAYTLEVVDLRDRLMIKLKYRKDRFLKESMKRHLGYLRKTLNTIIADPKMILREIDILSKEEKDQLLVDFNDTKVDYPKDTCIHELFEGQAKKTPDNIAVVFEDHQLTYKELEKRSKQLAIYLQRRGVQPDTLVGICMDRSVEMVVAILGILRAGGAYVPIDPSYPEERIRYMLEDGIINGNTQGAVKLVLTRESLTGTLESMANGQEVTFVSLTSDWDDNEEIKEMKGGLQRKVSSKDLAYVIYTSGSTGKPKGVMIEHKGIINTMYGQQKLVNVSSKNQLLQFASLSFDASIWEIFMALLRGASLHIISDSVKHDKEKFKHYLVDHSIEIATLPPKYAKLLDQEVFKQLKILITAGESASKKLIELMKGGIYFNAYGPTETSICATMYKVPFQDTLPPDIPIGSPIQNTSIYIVSNDLKLLPIGTPGELCIAGDGVTRGYLNRPELTAEKFIDNPLGEGKLYKTGDLARWLPDGNIEFLGRIDHQVKIRGFRVELGEIDTALNNHKDIQNAVVIAKEHSESKQLVAYCVLKNKDKELDVQELKAYLSKTLPDYMVPAFIITIDQIPLTPNGKTNRKALMAMELEITGTGEYVAPGTETEKQLATIWQEVLGVEQVGIHDNFFELGGDSILSIQIISRAKRSGVHLEIKDIFTSQTIAKLSKITKESVTVLSEQGNLEGNSPLLPVQSWFFDQEYQQSRHYNQSILVTLKAKVPASYLEKTLPLLYDHHDALRFTYKKEEKSLYPLQSYSMNTGKPLLEVVSLENGPEHEQEVSEMITDHCQKAQASFDLKTGPLFKAILFDGDIQYLFLVAHHLVIDGVSWRILLTDLQELLQGFTEGRSVDLGPKGTSYRQWVTALGEHVKTASLQKEISYWKEIKTGTTIPRDFKVENERSVNIIANAQHEVIYLDESMTQSLLQKVHKAYQTQINDLLLAAFMRAYFQWSGHQGVGIALEGHGREQLTNTIDISRTVGWFTSIFPVSLSMPEENTMASLIRHVKELVHSTPNAGIGYGMLRYLSDTKDFPELPEITFNYLGQFDQVTDQNSLFAFSSHSSGNPTADQNHRTSILDINGIIINNRLEFTITYCNKLHDQKSIQRLGEFFRESLVKIITHCSGKGLLSYTPSDFPLALLDQKSLDGLSADYGIENIANIYKLSPMQQGLLFETLLSPNAGMYHLQLLLELKGVLDVPAFEASWQQVIVHFDILRTVFPSQDLQIVLKDISFEMERIDLQHLDAEAQILEINKYKNEERINGFDLAHGPLFKVTLFTLAEHHYQVLISNHHIILDGWSNPILFSKLFEFYHTYTSAGVESFSEPVPYGRYIQWIYNQDESVAAHYWTSYLEGLQEIAPLPLLNFDQKREGQPRELYSGYSKELSKEFSEDLRAFAKAQKSTLNTLLETGWGILLGKLTGSDDVVFGSVGSGRQIEVEGMEDMVGLFINTLPVRIRNISGQTLSELLTFQQEATLERGLYGYSPLSSVQQWSGFSKGLFDTLFVMENYPIGDKGSKSSELELSLVEAQEQPHYVLNVVWVQGETLQLSINYDLHYYQEEQIERIVTYYLTTLQQIIGESTITTSDIDLLTPEDRERLLVDFNNTKVDYPKDICIHELFEEQAKKTPDNIAVVFEGQELTYQELEKRSKQLAIYLQKQGVGSDTLVGICMDRSLEMIVGILGILRAGGAYVPIDPSYPGERIRYMLEDGIVNGNPQNSVKLVLTQESLTGTLDPIIKGQEATFVSLTSDWNDNTEILETKGELQRKVSSKDLAYVIYTSGSMGKPKGVMIEHHSIFNMILSVKRLFGDNSSYKHLLLANFVFDASVQQIFYPLLTGAELHIIKNINEFDSLRNYIKSKKIHVIDATPSLLQVMLSSAEVASDFISVREIFVGGEEITAALSNTLLNVLPKAKIYNVYGPTETCINALYFPIKGLLTTSPPPIGKPFCNYDIYILDNNLFLQTIGIAGELCIAGDGLARGYLNRPELTKEKFIDNPFGEGRLYKTGDLARWLPDGNIEFLGRIDDLVKIRGFRIELGEIETTLNDHKDIQNAVVIAKEHSESKQLVAYCVLKNKDKELDVQELKAYLSKTLPDYMVPAFIITIDQIPLTPNGKTDRKALSSRELEALDSHEYTAPRTETEQQLVMIWQEVLGMAPIGVFDNFYELGGHSLLAVRLVQLVKQRLGNPSIQLRDFINAPTIDSFVQIMETGETADHPIKLEEEAIFSKPLTLPAKRTLSSQIDHILITGATGFVGRYLLKELLYSTPKSQSIHCLVRCTSVEHGFRRLREKMEGNELWEKEFEDRIIIVKGDIAEPHLGIDDATYERLSNTIHTVVHCATYMNHLSDYTTCKPANVSGMEEILHFCTAKRLKLLHHTSTLSIFHPGQDRRFVDETTTIDGETHLSKYGYEASKWVAERLAEKAASEGVPITTHRLGLIIWDTENKRYDPDQWFHQLLQSCDMLGMYPDFGKEGPKLQPIAVDVLAKDMSNYIANTSYGNRYAYKVLHHISAKRSFFEELFEAYYASEFEGLKRLKANKWFELAKAKALPIAPMLSLVDDIDSWDVANDIVFQNKRTATLLGKSDQYVEV